ncbi:unnamed protein product, partial [Phaeothamnion confervicola]
GGGGAGGRGGAKGGARGGGRKNSDAAPPTVSAVASKDGTATVASKEGASKATEEACKPEPPVAANADTAGAAAAAAVATATAPAATEGAAAPRKTVTEPAAAVAEAAPSLETSKGAAGAALDVAGDEATTDVPYQKPEAAMASALEPKASKGGARPPAIQAEMAAAAGGGAAVAPPAPAAASHAGDGTSVPSQSCNGASGGRGDPAEGAANGAKDDMEASVPRRPVVRLPDSASWEVSGPGASGAASSASSGAKAGEAVKTDGTAAADERAGALPAAKAVAGAPVAKAAVEKNAASAQAIAAGSVPKVSVDAKTLRPCIIFVREIEQALLTTYGRYGHFRALLSRLPAGTPLVIISGSTAATAAAAAAEPRSALMLGPSFIFAKRPSGSGAAAARASLDQALFDT